MAFPAPATLDLTTLRWLRTSERPAAFRLLAGEAPVATLAWTREAGAVARAESAVGAWRLTRGGFLNPHVVARAVDPVRAVGRLTVHLNHHAIEVEGGSSYRFHRAGVLLPAWTIADAAGTEVAHLEPIREGRELQGGAVVVAPGAVGKPELTLLLVLSWYFIVLAWFEDEALVPFEDHEPSP
jgi:hypothetical protein